MVNTKISGHHLVILGSTSLMESVMSQRSFLLATYIFAQPSSAKFVAQHVAAQSTFVNTIPAHILIGPAAPQSTLLPELGFKYSVAHFSQPRPQYSLPPSAHLSVLDSILDQPNSKDTVRKLRRIAVEPLTPTGQPLGRAIGFFEQGILIGLGLFLIVSVPLVGFGSWFGGRTIWKLIRQNML